MLQSLAAVMRKSYRCNYSLEGDSVRRIGESTQGMGVNPYELSKFGASVASANLTAVGLAHRQDV